MITIVIPRRASSLKFGAAFAPLHARAHSFMTYDIGAGIQTPYDIGRHEPRRNMPCIAVRCDGFPLRQAGMKVTAVVRQQYTSVHGKQSPACSGCRTPRSTHTVKPHQRHGKTHENSKLNGTVVDMVLSAGGRGHRVKPITRRRSVT